MRRAKIAYVLPEDIMGAFLYEGTGFPTLKNPHSTNVLRRLRFVGVPADSTIDGHVTYDFSRQAFAFLIEHPSFDEVPFGEIPPTVNTHVETFYCDHEGREIKPSDLVPPVVFKDCTFSSRGLSRLKALNDGTRGCETPEPKVDNPFDKTWRDKPSLL